MLDNFKSYQGKQTIGPFKPFAAIIGPNGAGTYENSCSTTSQTKPRAGPLPPGGAGLDKYNWVPFDAAQLSSWLGLTRALAAPLHSLLCP